MYISAFSTSSPSNYCCVVYSFGIFVMFSWLSYFTPKLFSFSVGIFSCHPPKLVSRIFFHCFRMSYFVAIVLPFVDIFLIFLLSSVLSGLFPQVLLLFFVLLYPFCPNLFQCFSFVLLFLPVFIAFLSAFLVKFPVQVLIFLSCSLRAPRFSQKLFLLLQRLVHFIRLSFCWYICKHWIYFLFLC